jgi:OOP family OmpA-OmpF porin
MKNFVKVASLVATLALAAQVNAAAITPMADAVNSRHVQDAADSQIWVSGDYGATNGTDKLCWQTGYYPDGNPVVGCDAVAKPPVVQMNGSLNLDAATLFDFDKASLRPAGQAMLGRLAAFLNRNSYSQTVVVGHTDSWGSDAYNDRLSLRRAESVKAYLVSQGVPAGKIVSQGMGERQLIVSPASCKGTKAARQACEQPNRRVTVDIQGASVPANQVEAWKRELSAVGVNVTK